MYMLSCAVPVAYLVLFYSFVLRARLTLGRWPYPDHPDPRYLGFDFHYLLTFLAGMLIIPATIVLFLWAVHEPKHYLTCRPFQFGLIFFIVGIVLLGVLNHVVPGDFGAWFID